MKGKPVGTLITKTEHIELANPVDVLADEGKIGKNENHTCWNFAKEYFLFCFVSFYLLFLFICFQLVLVVMHCSPSPHNRYDQALLVLN